MRDEFDDDDYTEYQCGGWSALIFMVSLVAGTACTVLSKTLFQQEAVGLSGELEPFRPRLFQTWIMFLAMSFALPIHLMSEARRRRNARGNAEELRHITAETVRLSNLRQFLPLTVPAMFDLISTALMVLGIMYINASVWMMLRGAGVVFVALMKNFFLSDALMPNMWVGVFTIACGVVLVGLSSKVGLYLSDGRDAAYQSTTGVTLTLLGTFVQVRGLPRSVFLWPGGSACAQLACVVSLHPHGFARRRRDLSPTPPPPHSTRNGDPLSCTHPLPLTPGCPWYPRP